ncbi:hypothetical protein A2U01_0110776, partial [Trifolium medium]|nr:hypothetical protein [Trifolium medium]
MEWAMKWRLKKVNLEAACVDLGLWTG